MKKVYLAIFSLALFLLITPVVTNASNLSSRLKGRILLQVHSNGEAWYVEPAKQERHYLGRPNDAFNIMRGLGLGISERDYYSFNNIAPARLSGRILLRVQAKGEAYYVNPLDLKMHYLGRPADAFNVMRSLGLGISNRDLEKIRCVRTSRLPGCSYNSVESPGAINSNDLNYFNSKYNFSLTFPERWKSYTVFEEVSPLSVTSFQFGFSNESMFSITVFTKNQWHNLGGSFYMYLGEKGDYVFAWESGSGITLGAPAGSVTDIANIIKSFKLH